MGKIQLFNINENLNRYLKAKYGREEAVKKMGHGMEMPFLARKANEIIEANQASMLCA